MNKPFALLLALVLTAASLSACGMRAEPKAPAGKIQPSNEY